VTSIDAPETVQCLRHNDLESSSDFVKHNLKRVPHNRTKYQRRPFFLFREVLRELGTVDSICNVVGEAGGDFSLLNDNLDLLFWEVETVWTRFHICGEGGLCLAGQRVC
jgi:hypothetical protein